ncbi:hypothetical protein AB1P65_13550 [Roseibium alexandrii]
MGSDYAGNQSADLLDARKKLLDQCQKTITLMNSLIDKNGHSFIWEKDDALNKKTEKVHLSGRSPHGVFSQEELVRGQRIMGSAVSKVKLAVVPWVCVSRDCLQSIIELNLSISRDVNDFRSVVERVAVLQGALKAWEPALHNGEVKDLHGLVDLPALTSKVLGTSFDWDKYQFSDFEDMDPKHSYVHDPDRTTSDFGRKQVLGFVDRMSKSRMVGLRAFYNFCCEFVHPNFGDMVSAGSLKSLVTTKYDHVASHTVIASDVFSVTNDNGFSYVNRLQILIKAYDFFASFLQCTDEIIEEISKVLASGQKMNQKNVHLNIKKSRTIFDNYDYCPCGSGKKVKFCIKNN